jgi:hypothetical protein
MWKWSLLSAMLVAAPFAVLIVKRRVLGKNEHRFGLLPAEGQVPDKEERDADDP